MKQRAGQQRSDRQARRLPRGLLAIAAAVALGLLAYSQVYRPNVQALTYQRQLDTAAGRLQECFRRLDATRSRQLFEAPDISLADKQRDVSAIKTVIRDCSGELARFNTGAQTLPSQQLGGFTGRYRAAHAARQEALDIAGQSRDVMAQYERLAGFLEQYYALLVPFEAYTADLNAVEDVSTLAGRQQSLANQAAELRSRADEMRRLQPFAGFGPVLEPTADAITLAADGIGTLAAGLAGTDDSTIDRGFAAIEAAAAVYDSQIRQLPFDQLQRTHVGSQVASLPSRLDTLRNH